MLLSDALKEAYASNPTNDLILYTIELYHASWADPIRVCSDTIDHTLLLEPDAPRNANENVPFISCAFDFSLPAKKKINEVTKLKLSIDGVSLILTQHILESTKHPGSEIEIIFREFLVSGTGPEFIVKGMLSDILVTNLRITGDVLLIRTINAEFPKDTYTIERFPGLAGWF